MVTTFTFSGRHRQPSRLYNSLGVSEYMYFQNSYHSFGNVQLRYSVALISIIHGFMAVISFTLYPAYISSVVIVGFLFNKSWLNLYFLVVQGLVLYLSLGWGIDVIVRRITLTLPLVHWFQLRLLLVNWEYLVDSLSGIMLVIIALISLNVNVYSVDLLDVDTHQEQFIWLLAIFAIWITVFVMSNNLIVLFFCWELVGLCSYLLISFWKERQQSVKCSFKAILYNKVGDISLLLSIGCT